MLDQFPQADEAAAPTLAAIAAILSPQVGAAIEAFRHLAGGQFAKLVFAQDALPPGNRFAETLECFGLHFGRKLVDEVFECFIVFERELADSAGPALRIRIDSEGNGIDDADGPPGAIQLLLEPGVVIADRLRLYENQAFIDGPGTNCHRPLFGFGLFLATDFLLAGDFFSRRLLALRGLFRRFG